MTHAPRLSRHRLIALDGLAAFAYLVLLAPTAAVRTDLSPRVAVPLLILIGAPMAARRLWPRPVFVTVLLASTAALFAGALSDPFVAAAYCLYPVALNTRRSWPPTVPVMTAAIAVLAFGSVAGSPSGSSSRAGMALLGAGLLVGAWAAGRLVYERRAETAHAAAELAGRAVAEERLRIARELHDVVAQHMSVIVVQAGTANHVMAARPGEAQAALQAIEATSRTALTEMRQLLGMLRSGAESIEPVPLPGPDGLPALIRRAEAAGVAVELEMKGTDGLPEGVAATVYRIVQEAVTNVVRHAAPARCRVSVRADSGAVTIEVLDDGAVTRARPSPPGDGPVGDFAWTGGVAEDAAGNDGTGGGETVDVMRSRHGLIGMRERALMHGGSFRAGPRPEGGFGVHARLPIEL